MVGNFLVNRIDVLGLIEPIDLLGSHMRAAAARKKKRMEDMLNGFNNGKNILLGLCDSCEDNRKPCCNKIQCKAAVNLFMDKMREVIIANYENGPGDDFLEGSQTVGSWFCWSWASMFQDAIKASGANKCLKSELVLLYIPGSTTVHYITSIYACCSKDVGATIDDGFESKGTFIHKGSYSELDIKGYKRANKETFDHNFKELVDDLPKHFEFLIP